MLDSCEWEYAAGSPDAVTVVKDEWSLTLHPAMQHERIVCSRADLLSFRSLGGLRRLNPLCPLQKPWWPAGLVHPGVRAHTRSSPWSMAGARAVNCGASPARACLGLGRTLGLPSIRTVPTVSASMLNVCSRRQQGAASQSCGLLFCSASASETLAEQHFSTQMTLQPPMRSAFIFSVCSRGTSRAASQHKHVLCGLPQCLPVCLILPADATAERCNSTWCSLPLCLPPCLLSAACNAGRPAPAQARWRAGFDHAAL